MFKHYLLRILDADTGTQAPAGGSDDGSADNDDAAGDTSGDSADDNKDSNDGASELLSKLGVSSTDDLKAIVEAKNKADKASRSQLENVQSDLGKANKSLSELTTQNAALLAQVAASKAGIVGDHIDDAAILAQAYVAGGKAKDVAAAMKMVVKNNPDFTAGAKTGPDGTAIFPDNLSGNKGGKKPDAGKLVDELNKYRITK